MASLHAEVTYITAVNDLWFFNVQGLLPPYTVDKQGAERMGKGT